MIVLRARDDDFGWTTNAKVGGTPGGANAVPPNRAKGFVATVGASGPGAEKPPRLGKYST